MAGNGIGGDMPATEAMLNNPYGNFVTELRNCTFVIIAVIVLERCLIMSRVVAGGNKELLEPSSVHVSKPNEIYIVENHGHKVTKMNFNGTGAKIPPIKSFPKLYLDMSIHCQMEYN